MIKCPYNDLELKVAMIGLKESTEDQLRQMNEYNETIPEEGVDLNKAIAAHNGISVVDYLNSPNYEQIEENYREYQLDQLVNFLMATLDVDHKQAWAIVMSQR